MSRDIKCGNTIIKNCYEDECGNLHSDILVVQQPLITYLFRKSMTKVVFHCVKGCDTREASHITVTGQTLEPTFWEVQNNSEKAVIEIDSNNGMTAKNLENLLRECCPQCLPEAPQNTLQK